MCRARCRARLRCHEPNDDDVCNPLPPHCCMSHHLQALKSTDQKLEEELEAHKRSGDQYLDKVWDVITLSHVHTCITLV